MPMKVQVQDVSAVKKRLEIEVPHEELDREMDRLVRDYSREARIPGFRRGHVPAEMIKRRFAKELEEDLKERIVSRSTSEALEQQGLKPLHDPVLEDVTFRPGEPLRFKALFEVRPAITLGPYKGLRVERPRVSVTDDDVSKALESLRRSAGRFVPVEARPAGDGDYVEVDASGKFPGGTADKDLRREGLMICIGSEENLPEFNEALRGASPGEERTFEVSYPPEYSAKNLAGRRVEYVMKVREIKRRELPDLNDSFAQEVGEKAGLEALRERLRVDLTAARERASLREGRENALRQLIESHSFEVPEILVEEQLRRQAEDLARVMAAQGADGDAIGKEWREMRDKQLELARRRVQGTLLLEDIARSEGIRASDEEVRERIARDAREIGVTPEALQQKLKADDAVQTLKDQLVREKTLDFILNEATISP